MAPFDRSYMTFFSSTVVNIALSCTVFELFYVEYYRDLEIWVRGHWRSLKLVPFKTLGTVSYSLFILTMNYGSILHHFCYKARYWSKIVIFSCRLAFDASVRGFPSEYCHPVWYGKTRMVGLPGGEKSLRICITV